jgi:hypothetical protein
MSTRVRLLAGILFLVLCLPLGAAPVQDAVTDWNAFLLSFAVPPPASRPANEIVVAGGYMHIAIYDAINTIDGGYTPYVTGLPAAAPGASREAAVAAAANRILTALYPVFTSTIAAHYSAAIGAVLDPVARDNGIAAGLAAANGLLTLRNFPNDGWQRNVSYSYITPPVAGSYQRTPPSFQPAGPVSFWLSQLTPFAMTSPSQFRVDPPPALDSQQWADDFNEVKTLGAATGSTRTDEQTTIALFYANPSAPLSVNPAVQYSLNLRNLSSQEGLTQDVTRNARYFAQAYTALADAFIGCWDSKYHYSFWRPVTAIRTDLDDGNDQTQTDPAWLPLIVTPGHPEYPSAHGCATSAMANSMAYFLGTKRPAQGVPLTGTDAGGNIIVRPVDSTDDVVREIIDARVYEGIHYRTSVVHGTILGRKAAQWVARFYFQPVDSPRAR